ncbi:hypothetical protein [Arenimonas caeni]|nr:hypothetical protein [Arenimonas caeni]
MFELSWFSDQDPVAAWWHPIALLSPEQREEFENVPAPQLWGEIGTRASQRVGVIQAKLVGPTGEERVIDLLINDWLDVQQGRYRYLATDQDGLIRVRMVLGEYLACEVVWEQS